MGPREAHKKSGGKKKPTRQASLLNKPVIEVKGKLGKAQKSRKRKIKKTESSTVDFYESKVDDREKTTRTDSSVVNSAPKNLQQEIPKKLRELMKSREQLSTSSKLSKRKQKSLKTDEYKRQQDATESWFKRPLAAIPKFEKKPGESDRAFYCRVEVESNDFMKIAKFENENECKVVENEKGQMEVEKKVRRKQIKNKEFREKRKAKKQNKMLESEQSKDFSDLQDHVAFNERIDRPPEISAMPRKAKEISKTERLSSFKFTEMMGNSNSSNPKNKVDPLKSWAYKERMQEERQRAIDMYRTIKAKKRSSVVS